MFSPSTAVILASANLVFNSVAEASSTLLVTTTSLFSATKLSNLILSPTAKNLYNR
ncbi:hypothetical protein [Campylobacter fetus]|uniref:hypothetical protein n=1 Tax=Campylobacter fetus TaxID=196 RepID=UPI001AECDDBF|nr:hypothetical protein [Campylobacter fetus]